MNSIAQPVSRPTSAPMLQRCTRAVHARWRRALAVLASGLWVAFCFPALAITPAEVLSRSPEADWRTPAPDDTYVMELDNQRRVVIELARAMAPRHAARIAALVKAGWYDGLAIVRVQDAYVTQWGDPEGIHPLPQGFTTTLAAEFSQPQLPAGWSYTPLGDRDVYANEVGFAAGWPVARNSRRGPVWLAHCYGMLGAGRDAAIDSGGGGELYAVIGHAPRHLDLNITLVGRVLAGMEHLAALPRGTEALGFYRTPVERTPIARARMLSDLPSNERPMVAVLKTESGSFAAWLAARRNRKDDWYVYPAGHIDLCNALPPVRVEWPHASPGA